MTKDEHKAYSKQYRAEGYGANSDARYRAKNKKRLAAYMREYRRRKKAQGCATTREGKV